MDFLLNAYWVDIKQKRLLFDYILNKMPTKPHRVPTVFKKKVHCFHCKLLVDFCLLKIVAYDSLCGTWEADASSQVNWRAWASERCSDKKQIGRWVGAFLSVDDVKTRAKKTSSWEGLCKPLLCPFTKGERSIMEVKEVIFFSLAIAALQSWTLVSLAAPFLS